MVTLSANGKYLYNSITNKPVFLTGDAPQMMSEMLSNADVNTYMADRASRGINALWVYAIDQVDQTAPPKDFFGNSPFSGAWYVSPVSAYWANQDYVIQQAAKYGITVFLNVSFVGGSGQGYDLNALLASSGATVSAYGTFLGKRYKSYKNIVYVLGGDSEIKISGLSGKIADLGTAIAAADPNHLITYEACRSVCSSQNGGNGVSSYQAYSGSPPSWLKLNWVYNTRATVVSGCQTAYSTASSLPPLMGEDWYELEHSMTGFQVRQEGYWEALSGCYLGRLFGNAAIYGFNSIHAGVTSPTWQSQLASTGSVGEQYLGFLMRSREHWLLAPDTMHTYLTANYGSGATLSVLARTTDGQTMIAYFSDGNATSKTINMAGIKSSSSTVNEWWYNPRTGVARHIGTHSNSGSMSFTAPDGNDWVLVLDDNSAGLPAPGLPNRYRHHDLLLHRGKRFRYDTPIRESSDARLSK